MILMLAFLKDVIESKIDIIRNNQTDKCQKILNIHVYIRLA